MSGGPVEGHHQARAKLAFAIGRLRDALKTMHVAQRSLVLTSTDEWPQVTLMWDPNLADGFHLFTQPARDIMPRRVAFGAATLAQLLQVTEHYQFEGFITSLFNEGRDQLSGLQMCADKLEELARILTPPKDGPYR